MEKGWKKNEMIFLYPNDNVNVQKRNTSLTFFSKKGRQNEQKNYKNQMWYCKTRKRTVDFFKFNDNLNLTNNKYLKIIK